MGYFTGHEEDRDRARAREWLRPCDIDNRCEACVACWALGLIGVGVMLGCLFWAGFVSWAYIYEGRDVALAMAYGDNLGFFLTVLTGSSWIWFPFMQGNGERW